MPETFKKNWKIYLCEAIGLIAFMISACVFSVLIFHPDSFVSGWNLRLRFVLMGMAMGVTAVTIFLSPFGKLSGSHINPAVTLTFWYLGKIETKDAAFYIIFQFLGATVGVLLSWLILGERLANKNVNFAVTIPDQNGALFSFAAEYIISFGMMTTVLIATNYVKIMRYTPYLASFLVALYISVEAPISGMSMNPARSFGSAAIANQWNSIWIYFVAPPLAMLSAAEAFLRVGSLKKVYCAKIYHFGKARCIFNCRFSELERNGEFIELTKEKKIIPPIAGLF